MQHFVLFFYNSKGAIIEIVYLRWKPPVPIHWHSELWGWNGGWIYSEAGSDVVMAPFSNDMEKNA